MAVGWIVRAFGVLVCGILGVVGLVVAGVEVWCWWVLRVLE